MKTSTLLVIAGAGLVGVYVLTRPSTSLASLTTSKPSTTSTVLSGLGNILGGVIVGASGSSSKPSSAGAVSGSSGSSAGISSSDFAQIRSDSASATNVINSDATGILQYDSQGSTDAPVYGIAGIDY